MMSAKVTEAKLDTRRQIKKLATEHANLELSTLASQCQGSEAVTDSN